MEESENPVSEYDIDVGEVKENSESVEKSKSEIPTFDFSERSWRTDFVLIVEGTRLHVSKAVLSLASPVFDTMFQSNFKERTCDELELPGKKLDDVLEFLRCIYPNTFTHITRDSAVKVLPLIEEYQVLQHKPRCEVSLLESVSEDTVVEELFRLLQVAYLYDLKVLRKRCIDLASCRSQEEVDEATRQFQPPAEALNRILANMIITMKGRITDLETKIKKISTESKNNIAKLRKTNAELTEELELLKQYLSADVRNIKDLKLDGDCNWKEMQEVLLINTGEKCLKSEKEVDIWDVPLVISTSTSQKNNREWITIQIKNKGKKIICRLKVRVVIVNRQPQGLNDIFTFEDSMGSMQFANMFLKPKYDAIDLKNGFIIDSKIGLIIQIYMSEPLRTCQFDFLTAFMSN
ncbi:uncharacterized protein LOC128551165 [Mercenaria mercenaria]|uniref:uncharacterized protein LOC128551165 n=1 Tax=Mercenaria mercenaria TaxID=6596 RepID=UPI00234EB161|nr:uncharacterized protein LOC128551165 [Mercenaria mercenaria]